MSDTPIEAANGSSSETLPISTADTNVLIKDALPNLMAAIDHTLQDVAGKRIAFMLLAFNGSNLLHVTNMAPDDGINALAQAAMTLCELTSPNGS